MNTSSTDSLAGSRAFTKAQVSAVGQAAANLRSIFGPSPTHAFDSIRADLFGAAPTEDRFIQFWSPGLIDRLHEPLSRYHE